MSKRTAKVLGGTLVVVVVLGVAIFATVWEPSIEPAKPESEQFAQAQIKHGEDVANAGACAVCHTAENGQRNAGGRALESPFGSIYTSNITPDKKTGIGQWSFEAFDRSMRDGVSRDGTHLYPAFPYTAFTHMSEDDMKALYAYLMSQPGVASTPPETKLPFPFNIRPLMAGWNLLFLDKGPVESQEDKTDQWNRGNYLVSALGHCSACHSPRNSLGAEKTGDDYMAGGKVEGWQAPALNSNSPAPIAWSEQALFDYLRHGFAKTHGAVAGSMTGVVSESTSKIPESDTRAIAAYIASLNDMDASQDEASITQQKANNAKTSLNPPLSEGAIIFGSACQSCHHSESGPVLFGVRPQLGLSSSLYLKEPDNVVQVVLNGVQRPAKTDLGYMAPFRHNLNDHQAAALINYMRTDLAGQPEWKDLTQKVSDIRKQTDSR
nr:cytochrome c [uncultured Halomonas sp.]